MRLEGQKSHLDKNRRKPRDVSNGVGNVISAIHIRPIGSFSVGRVSRETLGLGA